MVVLRVAEGTDLLRPDASARHDGLDAHRALLVSGFTMTDSGPAR